MPIKLNDTYVGDTITQADFDEMKLILNDAHCKLIDHSGRGAEFLGWLDLPVAYNRKEFEEIKKAAQYIQQNCDILIVIGIGGSYLGARAAIEFIKSPNYNLLNKETPDIYFSGNDLSASALKELLSICEGKIYASM